MRKTGIYQTLGSHTYFIPSPLPPQNPPLNLTPELLQEYEQAIRAIAKLNEISKKLPDKERFIKAYVLKEAMLSSAIENIHTTILDAFTQIEGLSSTNNKNTLLVVSYTKALQVSLQMMEQDNMPLVMRVLLAAHKALMDYGDGNAADPGNFRQQMVKVGNLVPPPAQEVPNLMRDLEMYINSEFVIESPLIKAGLAHVQFETIHPFLDGNGRIGRLLIILMLMQDKLLDAPIIYPSYYFKKYHHEYYTKLDYVRSRGDFEGWLVFYLKAIHYSAEDAYRRIEKINDLEQSLIATLQSNQTAILALKALFSCPVIDISRLSFMIQKSYNTANSMLQKFITLGIVRPLNEQKRNKLYQFQIYLEILEQEL